MIAGGNEAPPAGPKRPKEDRRPVLVRVLGGFEVVVEGRPLTRSDWQRVAAERLVKLLLVTPGRRISREVAAEVLWPEAEPEAGRGSLRKAVHFAGQALAGSDALVVADGWLRLDQARLDVDLDRLTDAMDEITRAPNASDADLERARAVALDLGGLDLLPDDAFEDWLTTPRERLRERWQWVALQAARQARAVGRMESALGLVGLLLERDPTDEAAHRLAIEIYAAEGRHHAARRQFDTCRRALRDDLDAEPSSETVDAFRAAARPTGHPALETGRSPRLVARRSELERLEPLLDRVLAGRVGALVISGPAGIGKSALLDETVSFLRAGGWRILSWRAVESGMALAYGPFRISLLQELRADEVDRWSEPARSAAAALAPGLGLEPRLAFADRAALVAALVDLVERLARSSPLLIAIDDLPWLDAASIELVAAVLAGLPTSPILVAATNRDEEPPTPMVRALLDQVRREDGLAIPLGPLSQRDIGPLILGHLGGDSVSPDLARAIFDRGLGNPLFCLELARAWRDHEAIRITDGRWTLAAAALPSALPATVRLLVARRTEMLPDPARETLVAAAELGAEVGFETLAAATGNDGRTLLDHLDAALASGLLVESERGYSFAHPLYRLAVRGAPGRRRRGEVCFAIARALGGVDPGAGPEAIHEAALRCSDPAPVAEHALTAGGLGVEAAVPLGIAFGFVAAGHERRLFDRDHALNLLEHSLAAWRRLPPDARRRYQGSAALVALAELTMAGDDDAGSTRVFREAIACARTPDELARAYTAFYWVPYRHGDFDGAFALLEEGLATLAADATLARARVQTAMGWCLLRLRRPGDALPLLEEAVEDLEAGGDQAGAMQALDFLGIVLRYVGRPSGGMRALERSLRLARTLDDAHGEMLARIHLAVANARSGHPAPARSHLGRAMELASIAGDRYGEAVGAWTAAEIEDLEGHRAAAADLRRKELELLASIGGNPRNEALAHAHLAHLARLDGDMAGFEREAGAARTCADATGDASYVAYIGSALEVSRWSSLET